MNSIHEKGEERKGEAGKRKGGDPRARARFDSQELIAPRRFSAASRIMEIPPEIFPADKIYLARVAVKSATGKTRED